MRQGAGAPAGQNVAVTNSGGGTLTAVTAAVSYAQGDGWLTVAAAGSGNSQTLANTVIPGTLAPGVYTATVNVTASGASSASYSVRFAVTASDVTLSSLDVTPATIVVNTHASQLFTAVAKDSDGNILDPQPAISWSVSDGQTINAANGVFTADTSAGGPYTVTAAASYGDVTKTVMATVTVVRPITVTAPAAGSVLLAGSTMTVTWTVMPDKTDTGIMIEVSPDGGETWARLTPEAINNDDAAVYDGNTGTFTWTVQSPVVVEGGAQVGLYSENARVRVSAPYAQMVTYDEAGPLSIRPADNPVAVPYLPHGENGASFHLVRVNDGGMTLQVRYPGRYTASITGLDGSRLGLWQGSGNAAFRIGGATVWAGAYCIRLDCSDGTTVVRPVFLAW